MITASIIFIVSIVVLIISARLFTNAAEKIGHWLNLPQFVIGIFIVGIGTSLPELISGTVAVYNQASEIVSGNIIGANISNLLLVTGFAVAINRKKIVLNSSYIYVDLHFLVGSFTVFYLIAYDGIIYLHEAIFGALVFLVYAYYLIKGNTENTTEHQSAKTKKTFPALAFVYLLIACTGIYFGADFTVSSLTEIATGLSIPKSIIALTALSLGTTLPELAVNITAIRNNKAEMAIGNILGSCIFNTLVIPAVAGSFGAIIVSEELIRFSLPVMAISGLLFYLLTHDKTISMWEGMLFVILYLLFVTKIAGY